MAGASFTSYNSGEHPDDVRLAQSTAEVPSGRFEHSFPAASVTVLEPAKAP
ncbi:hypothetical protein QQY66_00195 [Streptomyces sp. DG2A-72]|uniref:hypothetical protein n=1 Tax=Streptomyces sp. DG2A-72 TaxID=3051386 RepID=UPI00265B8692|nr:hypothetical protein [Streptomyces sp. DG2A-72]MDO0930214.1 hypothetical protein [Streptomyces sp. DG2A-72]